MAQAVPAARLLAGLLLLLGHAVAAETTYSALWGQNGELWDGTGPLGGQLFDWSFAGYRQGNEPLPSPPVTRSVTEFAVPGRTDTDTLKAALAWANSQPLSEDFLVLSVPAGRFELTEALNITRSRVVLRGAGRGQTTLYVPRSLFEVYGQNPDEVAPRGYVDNGGFINIVGSKPRAAQLAVVVQPARHGDTILKASRLELGPKGAAVDDASSIAVGQYVDTAWTDVNGRFNSLMFDDLWQPPAAYINATRVRFTSKVVAVDGQTVQLERRLPYDIQPGVNLVRLYALPDTVTDSGVEALTLHFKWELYAGHHLEKGMNAVFLSGVRDCWAREIGTINADSSVLIFDSQAATVQGVSIEVEQTRANTVPNPLSEPANYDGHWGIEHERSFDVLADGWESTCSLVHDVGTGSGSKWGVFMNGKLSEGGNLDLHRALAGPTLYTNIDVGASSEALLSGGPSAAGPNAVAGTTWWNIKSSRPVAPNRSNGTAGACSFGPLINLVGVDIAPDQAPSMCPTWTYERDLDIVPNLYDAMLAARRSRGPAPAVSSLPAAPSPGAAPWLPPDAAIAGAPAPAAAAAGPLPVQ